VSDERTLGSKPAVLAVTNIYGKLPAQDVDRARTFYSEKLGLSPYLEVHSHLYFEVGGATFIVFPSSGAPAGTHDQLGLVVEDVEAEVAQLRSRGVQFESYPPPPGATVSDGIMNLGQVKAAWFKDSEGNLISIAEFPGGSPLAGAAG
jgi:catechol 2,3-dioxygenase-like lactoylglutathione lyase family enzyme